MKVPQPPTKKKKKKNPREEQSKWQWSLLRATRRFCTSHQHHSPPWKMIFNLESNTQPTKSSVGIEKDTFRLTLGLKTYTPSKSWRGIYPNERANVAAANSPFLFPGGSDLLLPQRAWGLPHPRLGGGPCSVPWANRSVGSARLRDSPGQTRYLVP